MATVPDLSTTGLAALGLVAIRPASPYELVAFADRAQARFGSLTARWGILQAEASLASLDEAEALVASQPATV